MWPVLAVAVGLAVPTVRGYTHDCLTLADTFCGTARQLEARAYNWGKLASPPEEARVDFCVTSAVVAGSNWPVRYRQAYQRGCADGQMGR